ncbi:hypothetical protein [Gluconobacter sphaericus]|uniref:Uncharacterized protein n=1 Tax=Gluconobacter sphaericus NBRC 12467 TaxID=1307951 RepID=A0AA37SIG0_9PROT|nr:hypothetical protein [Gluconobacter sphaericus]MBF0884988.1 hypothetical protein [Gluconobacter sphaericus]MBS1096531.1 hypothetical protein [Gluconobacter sphaericus]GBR50809.1 hypothetical protein AA12467_0384 [Gluconobacter sphaericus NBRC 12467]GEB41790.1 hypothetical protein GSP01_05720 [Gluconobacter sphaericus NBRC 12467]GLQ84254.1 hypothetical protein GCM10007872_11620 [Gluconobacter sphaericus NBRC 12467]
MTKHSPAPETIITEPNAKKSCCSKMKTCCQKATRAREIGLAGMTAMATFGPKRFRPYFQQILAVIAVVTASVEFFRKRKS